MTVGAVAGDEESYEVFAPLFDKIISSRHGGYGNFLCFFAKKDHFASFSRVGLRKYVRMFLNFFTTRRQRR